MNYQAIKLAILRTGDTLRSGKYNAYLLPGFILTVILSPLFLFGSLFNNFTLLFENVPVLGWIFLVINGILSSLAQATHSFLILTILSPVYSYLSERLESDSTNNQYRFNVRDLFKNMLRTLRILVFMILTEVLLSGVVLFLFNSIGMGFLGIIALCLIQSFFFGWAFFDYSLERNAYNFKKTQSFVSSHWVSCILVGLIFQVISKIPYLGLALGAVLATILATYLYIELTHTPHKTHE